MPIGNDGQVDTAGRIQSDELELKLLRELIYSFQGIEGKIFYSNSIFNYIGFGQQSSRVLPTLKQWLKMLLGSQYLFVFNIHL